MSKSVNLWTHISVFMGVTESALLYVCQKPKMIGGFSSLVGLHCVFKIVWIKCFYLSILDLRYFYFCSLLDTFNSRSNFQRAFSQISVTVKQNLLYWVSHKDHEYSCYLFNFFLQINIFKYYHYQGFMTISSLKLVFVIWYFERIYSENIWSKKTN